MRLMISTLLVSLASIVWLVVLAGTASATVWWETRYDMTGSTNVVTVVRPDLDGAAGKYYVVAYRYEETDGECIPVRLELASSRLGFLLARLLLQCAFHCGAVHVPALLEPEQLAGDTLEPIVVQGYAGQGSRDATLELGDHRVQTGTFTSLPVPE